MNHIDTLTSQATPAQQERARAIAPDFAAHSGLQSHSCPDGYTLALANIVDSDAHPVPDTATRPASLVGYVPCYTVPLTYSDRPEAQDVRELLEWAQGWPESVTRVRLLAPRLNDDVTVGRLTLIWALQAALTPNR
jgi:hypothetical protein